MSKQILDAIDPGKTSKEYYRHVFLGETKNGRGSGLHLARNHPEVIKKIFSPPNKHGIYEVKWAKKGMKRPKLSTIAPDNWNRVEYQKRVNEAYYNPIGKARETEFGSGKFIMRGRDSAGLKWEFIMRRHPDHLEYVSSYPIYEKEI